MADTCREKGSNGRPSTVIIREPDEEGGGGIRDCELELERASEAETKTIIIETCKLGDVTARWIRVGNCLHKTTVVSGVISMGCMYFYPSHSYIYLPLGLASVTFAGVYAVSWQFDPFCKYQVEHNVHRLEKLPLHNIASSTPVVLIFRDDYRRKVLHNFVALAATGLCAWKIYKLFIE
ncbi:transmembrane protein 11-B, mitochondrial-like [Mizuhopecten yessoensis]|uniref:transmembrane protein 11-B, mitochondrial-like n=1 Tax=Mizuhopecten yessoensis TaxID=6573 RepID=UPI000B459636|nr:transmembrane protein 11-B, mitochondrial-like [Mizuhopecten yessoensis]